MPPDASSRPDIGLKRTETSISVYGPAEATITLNSLLVARCTNARPFPEAPAISSTTHRPETISQPSDISQPSGILLKSKRSSAPADQADRFPAMRQAASAGVATTTRRLDIFFIGSLAASIARLG